MDNDSETYAMYFAQYDSPMFELTVERSFLLLCGMVHSLFGDEIRVLFLIYAMMGVMLKMYALQRLAPFMSLSVALYISNFYILHEFTQIRVAVSAGLLLLMIPSLAERHYARSLGLMALAMVFHYSSILLLPLLLLSNKQMNVNQRLTWAGVILAGYAVHFAGINLTSLPIPYFSDKLEAYQTVRESGMLDEINVFNMVYLVKIAIYFYLLLMYDTMKPYCPHLAIMLKLMGISLASFTAFSFLPVFAFRASELYGVVEILLFAYVFYTVRPEWLGKTLVVMISMSLFAINVFYNDILKIM